MSFFGKVRDGLAHPSTLFVGVKVEQGLRPAFKFLILLALPLAAGTGVVYAFLPEPLPGDFPLGDPFSPLLPDNGGLLEDQSTPFPMSENERLAAGIGMAVAIYLIILGGSFVGAGWLYLFVRLFNVSNDYPSAFKVTVYSSVPSALFGWIPIVGGIVAIYSIYLEILAVSRIYDITMGRAFKIWIASFVSIIVIAAGIGIAIIFVGGAIFDQVRMRPLGF
jgi:hypothetical protein